MTASFTFTADAGTDTITTSAPHGKVTGDGPMVVRNVGGALPTGYTALLDVYAIVTGASTMKLALTSADALANVPILISNAGTGTHYLEIGIPYRRPRTYAPGVQLKSADLNDNFDAWKALYALLTAQPETIWNGDVSLLGDLFAGGTLGVTGAVTFTGGPVSLQSVISPTAITSTLDISDWAPTGLSTAVSIRQAVTNAGPGANVNINGLTGGAAGRILVLHALGTQANDTLTLVHESGGGAAANYFSLASGANLVLPRQGCVTLQYDGTSSRWRVIGKNF